MPKWYYDSGPTQVDHAAAFGFDRSRMPLCCFEQLAGATGLVLLHRLRSERSARRNPQWFLSVVAPRGPPSGF